MNPTDIREEGMMEKWFVAPWNLEKSKIDSLGIERKAMYLASAVDPIIADRDAEIARLKGWNEHFRGTSEKLLNELEASQSEITRLRVGLQRIERLNTGENGLPGAYAKIAIAALKEEG